MRSLGVFGGSFNPVHTGHVLLARHAREALGLDEVWFIPCGLSADGKALAPGELRLKWLRKALRGEEGLKASALELERGGVSRTVDTLRELRRKLGPGVDLTLLLGQDQAARLPAWKEAKRIPSLAKVALFRRPGSAGKAPGKVQAVYLDAPLLEISSTDVRRRIKKGLPVSLLLPPALSKDADLRKAFGT